MRCHCTRVSYYTPDPTGDPTRRATPTGATRPDGDVHISEAAYGWCASSLIVVWAQRACGVTQSFLIWFRFYDAYKHLLRTVTIISHLSDSLATVEERLAPSVDLVDSCAQRDARGCPARAHHLTDTRPFTTQRPNVLCVQ